MCAAAAAAAAAAEKTHPIGHVGIIAIIIDHKSNIYINLLSILASFNLLAIAIHIILGSFVLGIQS